MLITAQQWMKTPIEHIKNKRKRRNYNKGKCIIEKEDSASIAVANSKGYLQKPAVAAENARTTKLYVFEVAYEKA